MINNINSQLSANAHSLEWGHVYLKGEELSNFRERLISNRIKLKRLQYASSVNPAAAIFGSGFRLQQGYSVCADAICIPLAPAFNSKATRLVSNIFIKYLQRKW